MIDLHCHILPGIDDGPPSIEDSLELARAAVAAGISKLVATPHVSWHYTNDAPTIAQLTSELNDRLKSQGVPLEVLAGGEIAMTYAIELDVREISAFSLGGGPWLLVEPPFTQVVNNLDVILLNLQRAGHRILLAHPERCPAFHHDPKMLGTLVGEGVLTSITAGALVGRFGGEVRRFALRLAHEEMIHNVASDAHDCIRRPPGIASELEQAGLGPLAGWLSEEVPAAILGAEQIPTRPAISGAGVRPPRQSWWRRSAP
jgi:protein-tyrosine phosphatase